MTRRHGVGAPVPTGRLGGKARGHCERPIPRYARRNDERVIRSGAEGPTLGEALAAGDPSSGMWSLRACLAIRRPGGRGDLVTRMGNGVSMCLGLSLLLVGCSPAAAPSPGRTAIPVVATPAASSSTAPPASPSTGAIVTLLEGRWATGPIAIADIRASMVAAGIDPRDADAWIAEVGSPTRMSFELAFTGTAFRHSEETADSAMQVGEFGTFALSGNELVLTASSDTYTLKTTFADDELSLRWVSSTEHGTAQDKEKHHQYTIAFYCSAPFRRQR
jgi:hypothetical protein